MSEKFEQLQEDIHRMETKIDELKALVFDLTIKKCNKIADMQDACQHNYRWTGLANRCDICGKWQTPHMRRSSHNSNELS